MANTERGLARKVFDKVGLVTSAVTIPSEIIGLGTAIAGGSLGGVLFFLLYSKWNMLSLLNMVNLLSNKVGTTLNELWIG